MRLVSCGRAKRFIRCTASATVPLRRLLIKADFLFSGHWPKWQFINNIIMVMDAGHACTGID